MASDAYFDSLGDTLVRENSERIEFFLSQKRESRTSDSVKPVTASKSKRTAKPARKKA